MFESLIWLFIDNESNLLKKKGKLNIVEELHLKSKTLQRQIDVLYEIVVLYIQQILSRKYQKEVAPYIADPISY